MISEVRHRYTCEGETTCSRPGAVAVGAFTIGAPMGRLAIRRLSIEWAQLRSLEIEDLAVRRLHAREVVVNDSLTLAAGKVYFRVP